MCQTNMLIIFQLNKNFSLVDLVVKMKFFIFTLLSVQLFVFGLKNLFFNLYLFDHFRTNWNVINLYNRKILTEIKYKV